MKVDEIMTRDPHVIDPNTTIRDAARAMREDGVGALPVGENDRLIGMVTDRDIAMRAVAEDQAPGNTSVRSVMSEGVYYCFDDVDASEAAEVMARHKVQRLPVVNREKRLVGVLAMADLARQDADALVKAMKSVAEPTQAPRR